MKIGIIGYGKMGSAIFKLLATKPYEITVLNRSEEKATDRKNKFFNGLERSLRRGAISQDTLWEKRKLLKFTHRWEDLSSVNLVIETACEDDKEKLNIFHQLESVVKRNTIIVTNTSNISIEGLSEGLKHKGRFCGFHFFYPVFLIHLVEIIKWSGTPVELVDRLKDVCTRLEKKSIVVEDGPGSVINTILAYYYVEALYLMEEGLALPSKIDQLARKFFYLGPCESMDVIGIDFLLMGLRRLEYLLPTPKGNTIPFELPNKLLFQKRFGKHVSQGIYFYQKGKPVDDVPDFYINPLRGVPCENIRQDNEHIAKRLLYSIFNGSIDSLKRGRTSLEELDLGVKQVLLMQEGPFSMMRAIGENKLKEDFDLLARTTGERFHQPTFEFLNELNGGDARQTESKENVS